MRKHVSFLAAAAIAVGGFGLTSFAQEGQAQVQTQEREAEVRIERDRTTGERAGERVERTGQRVGDAVDRTAEGIGVRAPGEDHTAYPAANISDREANNIRGTLSAATEAALTQGQLRSVVQRMTTSDQERLIEFIDAQDFADLDALIAQFQRDWQQRYNEDFNIGERAAVYPPEQVRIVQGIIPDVHLARERVEGQLQTQQPEQQFGQQDQLRQQQDQAAQQQQPQPGLAADRDRPRDTTVRPDGEARVATDRERADAQAVDDNQVTVIFPESHGLPQVAVPLINEGTVLDAWRIDAPLTLDGQKLSNNVKQALTRAHQQSAQWPQDVNDAYRFVSHHIMLALMDRMDELDAQPAGAQQPGLGQQPGQFGQPGETQPRQAQPGQTGRQPGQTNY